MVYNDTQIHDSTNLVTRGVGFPSTLPVDLLGAIRAVGADKARVHLGIFNEPFLGLLLCGEKTVESRFSRSRVSPWHSVGIGDLVLVAGQGTKVYGFFYVVDVMYFELSSSVLQDLELKYSAGICSSADSQFWQSRADRRYATLIWTGEVTRVTVTKLTKRDRRGWVTFAFDDDGLF